MYISECARPYPTPLLNGARLECRFHTIQIKILNLSFTLFLRFLNFVHENTVSRYVLRKVRGGWKGLYFFALIPCLRTLLQVEIPYSVVTAESTVPTLAHKYLAAAYNEGN